MRPRVCSRCRLVNWPHFATQLPRLECDLCGGPTVPAAPLAWLELGISVDFAGPGYSSLELERFDLELDALARAATGHA